MTSANIPAYFKGIIGLLKECQNDLLVTNPENKPIGILSRNTGSWRFEPFRENQYVNDSEFTKETGRRLGMLDPDSVYIMKSEFEMAESIVKGNMECWRKYDYVYLEIIL